MITIRTTPDDLINMRFAYGPLMEIPLSYRVMINPAFQTLHRRWLEEAFRTLHGVDLPFTAAVVPPEGYIPDFLTPTPLTNHTSIEDDFEALLATPDEIIREDIQELIALHGDSEVRRYFLAHPREALWCLVEEWRMYWQMTLAHHWSQMISALEGDVLYRARLLAIKGPGDLLEDLHPSIKYRGDHLKIEAICQHNHGDFELQMNGDGVQLVPTIFRGCGRMYQFNDISRPMLAYGVHGTGLWYQKMPSQSLELTLGAARARVLETLITPASTGEIAHKLGITSGGVSEHLKRLTQAGLAEPHRNGKRVYYQLTRRGEELIALFERPL